MTDAYERLVALAQREQAVIAAGRYEQLAALISERDALVASLPPTAPAGALPALRRAAELQAETTRRLDSARRQVAGELRRLARGRTTVRGYTPPAARVGLVDRAG